MNTDEIRKKIKASEDLWKASEYLWDGLVAALDAEIDRLRGALENQDFQHFQEKQLIEQRIKGAIWESIKEFLNCKDGDKIFLPDGFLFLKDFKQAIESVEIT